MQSACWNVPYATSTVKSLVLYMKIVLFLLFTYCAHLTCDNELLVFYSTFWLSIEVVYLQCCYFVVVECDISLKALNWNQIMQTACWSVTYATSTVKSLVCCGGDSYAGNLFLIRTKQFERCHFCMQTSRSVTMFIILFHNCNLRKEHVQLFLTWW